jgi:glycosyltransferase involved in cell wall biosynthesis
LKTVTFVFQRNIFPKSSGYPLRASRWLEAFAGKANVHVVFINARPMNPGAEDYLNGLGVASWKHFEVNRFRGAFNALWYLFTRRMPLQVGFYADRRARNYLNTLPKADLAFFSERRVGDYLRNVRAKETWIDLCDLVDDNYKTGAARMNWSPYKLYYLLEWPLLRRWDIKLAKKTDRTFLVTEYFARMLARRLNGHAGKIKALENGINIELEGAAPQGRYGWYFLGPLSYKPNYDGLKWFLDHVQPFISRKYEGKVIGVNAPESLRHRLHEAGITYLEYAEDLDSELKDYGICIAPMISGGGLLNKCLEAFHSGRIVILSPRASTGFKNIQNGIHALVCDKAEAWLQAFDDINSGRYVWHQKRIQHLVDGYSWERFNEEADGFLRS